MTIGLPSLCSKCARNRRGIGTDRNGISTGTCDAFPDGIPVEIFAGGFDHREPFGDEELLFEPAPGVTEREIDRVVDLAAELAELDD